MVTVRAVEMIRTAPELAYVAPCLGVKGELSGRRCDCDVGRLSRQHSWP